VQVFKVSVITYFLIVRYQVAIKTAQMVEDSKTSPWNAYVTPYGNDIGKYQGKLNGLSTIPFRLIEIIYKYINIYIYIYIYIYKYILGMIELMDEAKTMAAIGYHEHIVNLQGVCIEESANNLISEVF
jgi:hypothetical protein